MRFPRILIALVLAAMSASPISAQDAPQGKAAFQAELRNRSAEEWAAISASATTPREMADVLIWMSRVGAVELVPAARDLAKRLLESAEADGYRDVVAFAAGEFDTFDVTDIASWRFDERSLAWWVGQSTRPFEWSAAGGRTTAKDPRRVDDPRIARFLYTWRLEKKYFVDEAFQVLGESSVDDDTRQAAAYYLMRTRPADRKKDLAALLGDDDPRVVAHIARGVGAMNDSEFVGPLVAAALEQKDRGARIQILRALGSLGKRGAVAAIMPALSSGDSHLARVALEALASVAGDAEMSPKEKSALASVCRVVIAEDPTDAVRAAAVAPLAALDAKVFEDLWSEIRLAAPWPVRAAYARSIATVPGPRLDRLETMLGDPDRRVVCAAVEARTAIRSGDLVTDLLDVISNSEDAAVLASALDGLATVKSPNDNERDRLWNGIETAWKRLPRSDCECKQSAIKLAVALGDTRTNPFLASIIERDGQIPIREIAAAELRKRDPSANFEIGMWKGTSLDELAEELASRSAVIARIKTSRGELTARLYAKEAPFTVANFVSLARAGFYDGVLWHRVVPDFVAQAGCPRGDGWGGPDHSIRCEINDFTYRRGALGMALAGKDTGGSQWFFCLSHQPHLDGRYTLFGQLEKGFEVLDALDQGDRIETIVVE